MQVLPRCFRDVHGAAKSRPLANLAQVDYRVGVGEHVALVQRPLDQAVERRLLRSDQQHAADPGRVVNVAPITSAFSR